MIPVPSGLRIENIILYLRTKWSIVTIIFLINIFENLTGLVSMRQGAFVYIALSIVVVPALFLQHLAKKGVTNAPLTHVSLVLDLLTVLFVLYLHGGIQNSWLFMPMFIIFIAAYIFSFTAGLAYAMLAFLIVLAMGLLQYTRMIPHLPLFDLPEEHWRNVRYMADYFAGMFVLYFSCAFAVGALTKLAARRATRIDEYKENLQKCKDKETEVKEKIRLAKVEILVKNAELERIQVKAARQQLRLIDLKKEIDNLKRI